MTLDTFIKTYNNKKVDFDGKYSSQCVDLFRFYVRDVLGLSQPKGVVGAKDFWTAYESDKNLKDNFEKIPNTPTGVPQAGDVMIWGSRYGKYGHIAIVTHATVNEFTAFSQNDPIGSASVKRKYSYNAVLGWLRPKGANMDFIDLKKRLIDKHWFELTEFEDLRKRKLIDRADSIQTQTQKWLKSDASLRAEVEILVKMKKETENALQEATEGHKKAVEQAKVTELKFENYKIESEARVKELEETLESAENTYRNMKTEMIKLVKLLERCEAKNLQEYTIGEAFSILLSSITKWLKKQ